MNLSLKYRLGIKYKWFRKVLRFFGNRTFIKRDAGDNVVGFVWISGPSESTQHVAITMAQRAWTEET